MCPSRPARVSRERDEKAYPIFKKRTFGGAVSAQGGGKRTAGSAGQRSKGGLEEAGEVRRRAGAGSFPATIATRGSLLALAGGGCGKPPLCWACTWAQSPPGQFS